MQSSVKIKRERESRNMKKISDFFFDNLDKIIMEIILKAITKQYSQLFRWGENNMTNNYLLFS